MSNHFPFLFIDEKSIAYTARRRTKYILHPSQLRFSHWSKFWPMKFHLSAIENEMHRCVRECVMCSISFVSKEANNIVNYVLLRNRLLVYLFLWKCVGNLKQIISMKIDELREKEFVENTLIDVQWLLNEHPIHELLIFHRKNI